MSKEAKSVFSIEPAEVFLASKGLTPAMFEMESIFLHFGRYGWHIPSYEWWMFDVYRNKAYLLCHCSGQNSCEHGSSSYFVKDSFLQLSSILKVRDDYFWTVANTMLEHKAEVERYEYIVSLKEDLQNGTIRATGLRRKI